ncbi:50S ribosomal protein L3 [Candidatus Giovannonibacteria bacterium RIFCSPLOWO2_02_FULL_45_14]|uniref:Large ribosomal subunit protein uL3 n=3 Tax=Parcubacteria group TaxID=1794811 RepID=A0A0H4TXG4_9BACT|nr:Ribosomal protein L3, large subunit ribosomal protein L3 [uncultured Parcubacteria bacterium Rifle_16ft_4_minimus_37658]AKQ05724.1 Ribosomal protein L3, large subunit ribosomal protein L3 [uncultured Parcubacteria bacterium Rifle_16ft_4_minimus_23641]OGF70226.1 MAG: 50S ribosomal protein L3 [Candidatus Giovannonibacteria bacterium RIFCSPHIGHO2_02_FULL_44_31]OGF76311.1 MAG: 50S ribosomal protein L3 [Candidatus Giovannonibacteria bacterium RIFCSPHIGHO2_12_FULL_44_29]OGF90609.1 MAG: 50S ribosom
MAKFMLAQKIKMSQIFDEAGNVIPVTVLRAGPLTVSQVKNKEKDKYEALQVAFGEKREKNLTKAQRGHLKDLGSFRWLREFRVSAGEAKRGDKIDISIFKEGDVVKARSSSKGRGFQGAVKRHGFRGGPRTHGQKHSEREVGSIGATWPQRVIKGKKMPGRMGGNMVTVKNLKIIKIEPEKNILYVSGALPGARGALVEIIG